MNTFPRLLAITSLCAVLTQAGCATTSVEDDLTLQNMKEIELMQEVAQQAAKREETEPVRRDRSTRELIELSPYEPRELALLEPPHDFKQVGVQKMNLTSRRIFFEGLELRPFVIWRSEDLALFIIAGIDETGEDAAATDELMELYSEIREAPVTLKSHFWNGRDISEKQIDYTEFGDAKLDRHRIYSYWPGYRFHLILSGLSEAFENRKQELRETLERFETRLEEYLEQ